MLSTENFVYKKEVDWSLLTEGLTLPVENQVVFGKNMGRFLYRGESKDIHLIINGKSYNAKVHNVNYAKRHKRKKDTFQIRYPQKGELASTLRAIFNNSYSYINSVRQLRGKNDRSYVRLPEKDKEYLAIYTTEYDDTFLLEAIFSEDITALNNAVLSSNEYIMEANFNYATDSTASIFEDTRLMKFRRLNRAIGDNLKLRYNYRCQICGERIGNEYDSCVVEAHHIDYFIHSLNNDDKNIMVLCPNHHSIIHDVDPKYDSNNKTYVYPNGLQEQLKLNVHL